MTSAAAILGMIEAVGTPKPDQGAFEVMPRLKEINLKVMYFVMPEEEVFKYLIYDAIGAPVKPWPEYCTSRDALRMIRPGGWMIASVPNMLANELGSYFGEARRGPDFASFTGLYSPDLPTEELAELHAIIQAIEFERTHGEVKHLLDESNKVLETMEWKE